MVALSLVLGGVLWAHDEEPGEAVATASPGPARTAGARVDARAAQPERRPTGTGLHGPRSEPPGTGGDVGAVSPRRPSLPAATRRSPAPPRPSTLPRSPAPPRPSALPRSRATRLVISYLDVDAPVTGLRLDKDRRLTAPPDDDPNLVGWYGDGPSPGQQGTAVAVGHLDTDTGSAVFAGLTELRRGRLVEVRRADGRTAVYAVDAVKEYEKDRFPNREVYSPRGRPELRLITCGGTYDRRTGYSGNVVVFAHLTRIIEPRGSVGAR